MKKTCCFLCILGLCLTLLTACSSIGDSAASSGVGTGSTTTQSTDAPAGMDVVYQQTGSYAVQQSQPFQLNGNSVIAFTCQNGGDFGVLVYDASRYDTQVSQVMTSQCNPQDSNQETFTFNGPAYVSITADSFNTQIEWTVTVLTQQ